MGQVAKLTKGTRSLDLESGRYALGLDYSPPRTNIVGDYATGTSANRYGGASKVGEKALPTSFGFSVRILGSTVAEVERGRHDIQWFLRQAGDENEPVYFEWNPSDDVGFEPLWGQFGANYRVEVLEGSVSPQYYATKYRSRGMMVDVRMLINPFALGKKQRLGSAIGGVLEDTIGTMDGRSRGTIIPEATQNHVVNPVFGNSTWNSAWSDGASLTDIENTDPEFILFGTSSAKLTTIAGTAVQKSFTQSIDVGDVNSYMLSVYVKRPDKAAITTADCDLYYNEEVTTTFTEVGNGWYRLTAAVTGIAASTDTGIKVEAYRTLYVDGFQLEEKAFATPLCYGDLLGCSWDATAHGGTVDTDYSSRTAARIRVDDGDVWSNGQGTIRICMKMNIAAPSNDRYIWAMDLTADAMLIYDQGNDDWSFRDGTNVALSAGDGSFALGDEIVFHCVYKPVDGLVLYMNGVSIATNATYTPQDSANYLYIGSSAAAASHINATFRGFATFDRAMTATEVLADYTNIAPLVADDQRIEPIPYLWTKDGDDVVDNCDDADYDNWCVIGGVPGDNATEPRFNITFDAGRTGDTFNICRADLDYYKFTLPENFMFFDLSGTADAAACGGEHDDTAITSAWTSIGYGAPGAHPALLGKNINMFTVIHADGARTCDLRWAVSLPEAYYSDAKIGVSIDATLSLYRIPPLYLYNAKELMAFGDYSSLLNDIGVGVNLYAKDPDATPTLSVDYIALFPEPTITAYVDTGGDYFTLHGYQCGGTIAGSNFESDYLYNTEGSPITLLPDKYNIIMSIRGDNDQTQSASTSFTYTSTYIIPRWSIV